MFLADRLNISTEREYTDEGFLKVPARISRIGIQEYLAVELGLSDRDPKDIIRVYRPEEEVFSDESLSSFASKPVTNNHPPHLVDARNFRKYGVGFSEPEVIRDDIYAKTVLHITDDESIKSIESGKCELSNGYTADIDWTEGISPNGEQYDAVQRNIKGNHIAIVERGRAGPDCRLADNSLNLGDEPAMAKITIDGVDFEVSDQAAQAVGKLQASLSDAEKEAEMKAKEMKAKEDEMEEKAKKAMKTKDSLQAKLDDANSKIPSTEALDNLVADRTALVDSVLKVSPGTEWQGKDADTLRREVVAAKCQNIQLDSASTDYIEARFDMLVESVGTSNNQLDNALSQQITSNNSTVEDSRPLDVIAREKMMADSQNAWKTKGAK